ncbi:MAG: patatin-like phospholipase family protein [Planctomycetaceae bacterium]|jgi:patatin-like phospholipase/acyl hydrolase|nr:patatin-like phospholipase family protein [Planctomycetaceae bacterium]
MFKILSIDGGGFRGIYAAHILKKIEEIYNVSWTTDFNMITGTSTGSIIAAGLVAGISAKDIVDLYEALGNKVFKKRFLGNFPGASLFMSPYNVKILKKELDDVFHNKPPLGKIEFPLLIPATDIGNGSVYVFKSQYSPDFVRDKDVELEDAVAASCSAPMYFDPCKADDYLLADGGLWANSPAIIAAVDAKYRLQRSFDELQVLSIGTCGNRTYYSQKRGFWNKIFGWGFLTRWNKAQLVDMILNLQVQSANNLLRLVLNPNQILRIDSKSNIALDDPSMKDDLITRADKDFTNNSQKIEHFLQAK